MTGTARLLALSAVTDAQRREFYQRMFPLQHEILSEHWRWWYRVGEFDGIEPIAAVLDGAMVGQAGVQPVRLETGDGIRTAIWYIDFAVVPERQGMGLGKELTQAWMALCPLQIAFCVERSMRVFRKFGWRESFQTHRCAAPLQPLRVLASRTSWLKLPGALRQSALLADVSSRWLRGRLEGAPVLSPEPLDPDRLASRMAAAEPASGDAVSILRDGNWIEWRFARNPRRAELLLFETDGAFAVARSFRQQGLKRFHILYVNGSGGDDIMLYRGMTRWALLEGLDLVWMSTGDAALPPRLKSFLPNQAPVGVVSFSADAAMRARLDAGIRGLQAVDGDNDLLYASDKPCN